MKEQIISYETAKFAIKKGFNAYIIEDNTPTQSLLQKWLRDIHYLHIVIIPTINMYWTYKITSIANDSTIETVPYKNVSANDYNTYEEALEMGLQEIVSFLSIMVALYSKIF